MLNIYIIDTMQNKHGILLNMLIKKRGIYYVKSL